MNLKIPHSSLTNSISNPVDLLITCASFEDRCLCASLALPAQQIRSTIIFFIEEFSSSSSGNKSKLLSHFNKAQEISLPHNDPRRTADEIVDVITQSLSDHENILVDISTFTRESLLILIKALEEKKQPHQKFQLVYTGATEYDSTNLSYNPIELRSVMGYIGEMKPAIPLHLVIMLGFEYERAQQVIDSYEPDYISIGYGSKAESISLDSHKLNIEFKKKLVSIYTGNVINKFEHSLVDPFDVEDKLAKIIDQKTDYNTVIVPLNNKISTVGAALLAIKRPEIQICYTQMGKYNFENYSRASDHCYLISLWK